MVMHFCSNVSFLLFKSFFIITYYLEIITFIQQEYITSIKSDSKDEQIPCHLWI